MSTMVLTANMTFDSNVKVKILKVCLHTFLDIIDAYF